MADKNKKYCVTKIPKSWPQFRTPAWTPGMKVQEAQRLWFGYVRLVQNITPTPRVYGRKGE